ncbi:MAG: WYL domain-containing protein, partial [Chloroflexi bacterium]|nr:WYL domain-containing protein [Chloroflexota bacterium]
SACVTEQPCVRPENFDLAAYWAQSMVEFKQALPDYAVMVRAAPEVVARLHNPGRFARIIQRYPADADGWIQLEMQLDVEENACEYLLGFGAQVEILAPPTLREKVVQQAQSIVALYA